MAKEDPSTEGGAVPAPLWEIRGPSLRRLPPPPTLALPTTVTVSITHRFVTDTVHVTVAATAAARGCAIAQRALGIPPC